MTTVVPSDWLSSADSTWFRFQLLDISSIGDIARDAGCITWDAAMNAARMAAGEAAGRAAGDVAWKAAGRAAGYVTREAAWKAAWEVAWGAAREAAKKVIGRNKGGTPRQIVYASCRSVILDRKKIIKAIEDDLSDVPSTPMTIDEVSKCCIIMMSFDEKKFEKLRLTVSLQLVNYLLKYECIISILRQCGNERYYTLMDMHTKLVRRLGLESSYAKLMNAKVNIVELGKHLPTIPAVLIDIIIGYCALTLDVPEDKDEIYDRLLLFDEFQNV